jgi:hypothetical protein
MSTGIRPFVDDEVITATAGAIWDVMSGGGLPADKGQLCSLLARAALQAAAPLITAAADRARCDAGGHAESVAGPDVPIYLGNGARLEPGTRFCRYCSAILERPQTGQESSGDIDRDEKTATPRSRPDA